MGGESTARRFDGSDGVPGLAATRLYAPNAYGLYDMTGNVWEWTWDWYVPFSAASESDPVGPESGDKKVVRGGGWKDGPDRARVANRGGADPERQVADVGFRLVRTAR